MASANLLGNSIRVEQAQALLKIKNAKPGLTTLCCLSGDETELDLSKKGLSSGCAVLLAPEIEANGALASLKINKCALPIQEIKTATELDLSGKGLKQEDAIVISALIQVRYTSQQHKMLTSAFCHQDNGALASLNISGNRIGSDQHAKIRKICAEKSIK